MPQLSAADREEDLGANDELLRFKDEGEHEDKTNAAADRDLDDVKSSLVNESETNSGSDSEADRRARAEPDVASRARQNQLFGEALRRQQAAGLFPPPPYVGYPFFMIPDLCGSYLAGGARAYLPFQWPLLDIPGRAAMRDSATPTHLSSGVRPHMSHLHPLLSYCPEAFSPQRVSPSFSPDAGVSRPPHTACYPVSPGGMAQMPHTLDWLQGQSMYPMAGGFSPTALAINTSMSSLAPSGFSPRLVASSQSSVSHATVIVKQEVGGDSPPRKSAAVGAREGGSEQKAHIKKPLNAFMLFMREERPKVVAQCQVKESATINQILGQRWHSLSKEEQAKYYELARKERLLHSQLYPGWSARDNYGKKKKRKKTRTEMQQDADESSPQPKRAHASPDEAPHVHALLTHTRSLTSASAHSRPHMSRPHGVSHLTHTHLSQASPASSVDSPATPTAALASPAAPAPTHTEHTHSSHGHSGRASPCSEQPLALTTKPPCGTHPPAAPTPSPDTPSPHTPTPLPFLAPPPSSSQQSRRANQV